MANMAVIPGSAAPLTVVIQGRTYTSTLGGAPLIVPDFDGLVLLANGWLSTARDGAGTTAQRPTLGLGNVLNPKAGFEYYDSTVGANIIWNGKNWIHHATGSTA